MLVSGQHPEMESDKECGAAVSTAGVVGKVRFMRRDQAAEAAENREQAPVFVSRSR